jgi:hypothetical protein
MQKAERLKTQCLNELGLKQLKAWIEADEEKRTNKVGNTVVFARGSAADPVMGVFRTSNTVGGGVFSPSRG